MDVNRYCLNDVIVLHARGTRGVPGVGNTKFIPSFTRMARVLGAPRGRRVEFTVNRLSTTTVLLITNVDHIVQSLHLKKFF